jgi:hypothetical protein
MWCQSELVPNILLKSLAVGLVAGSHFRLFGDTEDRPLGEAARPFKTRVASESPRCSWVHRGSWPAPWPRPEDA